MSRNVALPPTITSTSIQLCAGHRDFTTSGRGLLGTGCCQSKRPKQELFKHPRHRRCNTVLCSSTITHMLGHRQKSDTAQRKLDVFGMWRSATVTCPRPQTKRHRFHSDAHTKPVCEDTPQRAPPRIEGPANHKPPTAMLDCVPRHKKDAPSRITQRAAGGTPRAANAAIGMPRLCSAQIRAHAHSAPTCTRIDTKTAVVGHTASSISSRDCVCRAACVGCDGFIVRLRQHDTDSIVSVGAHRVWRACMPDHLHAATRLLGMEPHH